MPLSLIGSDRLVPDRNWHGDIGELLARDIGLQGEDLKLKGAALDARLPTGRTRESYRNIIAIWEAEMERRDKNL